MKKIKILLLLLTIAVAGFYSCTDNDPVENEVVTTKSISLRTTLNEIKKANNISGKNGLETQDQFFCFNFVYPITLSYNNGTTVTVNSADGLLEILLNENSTLYIDGIAFPFQVQEEGTITTINNEAEFYALILGCANFQTVNECVFDFTCYEIVYPISIVNANNETVVIETQAELMQYVSTPTGNSTYQLNIVFPISIEQNGLTIVVNDLYEFFDINNDCAGSSCICTADYNPVCVQTSAGIVGYSNACFALCAGFTEADFVSCNNVAIDFSSVLGSCFNVAYPVQIQYQGALVTVNNNSELLQYYFPAQSDIPAFVYPILVSFNTPTGPWTVTIENAWDFQYSIGEFCN